jgi:hypothetical protein
VASPLQILVPAAKEAARIEAEEAAARAAELAAAEAEAEAAAREEEGYEAAPAYYAAAPAVRATGEVARVLEALKRSPLMLELPANTRGLDAVTGLVSSTVTRGLMWIWGWCGHWGPTI